MVIANKNCEKRENYVKKPVFKEIINSFIRKKRKKDGPNELEL